MNINSGENHVGENNRALLQQYQMQQNAQNDYNQQRAPETWCEKIKWFSGLENRVDSSVRGNYNNNIRKLESIRPTSIQDLQNQMVGFWVEERKVIDYERFKKEEYNKLGRVTKAIVDIVGWVLSLNIPSAARVNLKAWDQVSKEVEIGGFSIDHDREHAGEYVVVASHPVKSGEAREFVSESRGITTIEICRKDKRFNARTDCRIGVSIERWTSDSDKHRLLTEFDATERPVLKRPRNLKVANIHYNRDDNEEGSNRVLDRKLTQIMVEVAKQTESINKVKVNSNQNDYPLLVASGFINDEIDNASDANKIRAKIKQFREENENFLFPPYDDYGSIDVHFSLPFSKDNPVSYERKWDNSQSWDAIIEESPILRPGSAALPEYWAKKPHIQQQR